MPFLPENARNQFQPVTEFHPALANSENYIINGNFFISQKGSSFISAWGVKQETVDGWFYNCDGSGGSITHSRVSFSPGSQEVPGNTAIYSRLQRVTASTGSTRMYLAQRIENVRLLAGRNVVVSFMFRSNIALPSGTQTVGLNSYPIGSASVIGTQKAFEYTTPNVWQYIVVPHTMPDIVGSTLAAGHCSELAILDNYVGALHYVDITNVKLEIGDAPTPFKYTAKDIANDTFQAMRRYQQSFEYNIAPVQGNGQGRELFSYATNGSHGYWRFNLKANMQKPPTMTFYNPAVANALPYNFLRGNSALGIAYTPNYGSFEVDMSPGAGWVAGDLIGLQWKAEAYL